jgi:hypothetical protein
LNSPLAQACGDCVTCDPHRRDSQCITMLTSGRCVQHAREDGRCVFHSQKFINICETIPSLSCICMSLQTMKCLNHADPALRTKYGHCTCCKSGTLCVYLTHAYTDQFLIHCDPFARHGTISYTPLSEAHERGHGPLKAHRTDTLDTNRHDWFMDEFLGFYKKNGEWYAQVASSIGVFRQLGPFDTGVEADLS